MNKPKDYTYINPAEVQTMPQDELLQRLDWLVKSQVARYCWHRAGRRDAEQVAKLMILKKLKDYSPDRGVHFEGWVRIYIAAALVQFSIDFPSPVHIPEKARRDGRAVSVPWVTIEELEEAGTSRALSVEDTQVEDRDRESTLTVLWDTVSWRIDALEPGDRDLVRRYLGAKGASRRCRVFDRVRELLPTLTDGLGALAAEVL